MNTRCILLLAALWAMRTPTFAQQPSPPQRGAGGDDILVVIYEFQLTADGKVHNIKVAQVLHKKDRSNADGALTDAEKARGATLIAANPYHPRPDQVGMKRYDFVLFDPRSRRFDREITSR